MKHSESIGMGSLIGLILAVLVAAIPTFLDWNQNPAGIFQGPAGTDWGIVFETFISWFWPVALVLVPVAILALVWVAARQSGN